MEASNSWPPIITPQTYDSNQNEGLSTKSTKTNARPHPNMWIMRSMSNEEELDSYYPPIISNKGIESPIESHTSKHPLSFSTFVDGSQRTNSFIEMDRDSSF